ncbi:MAG: UbiH/UbiF/VisC/COQ6 family ubiquinone biosynthesis hydroxylase [Paracoccaceae bacterium]|nr:UbiH/UbiF/VisC/COQ6 family ubiquinone biosynthesis hydroxylase [Paracoccaceae bacterium]
MSHRHDILIVGGGLVGPALALALAEVGFDVAIVDQVAPERRAAPDFDGRAYAVALGSSRLLDTIGIWEAVAEKAEPVRDIHVGEGVPADVPLLHFDPRETDDGRVGWILEDRWLRGALLSALDQAKSVTQIAPAEIAEAEFDAYSATLHIAEGGTLRAPLAIACDGRRSPLAQAAGIRRLRWGYGQTGLVNAISHELPHHGLAHQSFFPGGPFAVLPLPDDGDDGGGEHRSSLVWSERTEEAERLHALDDDAFIEAVVERIGPRLGKIGLAGKRWAYPLDLTLAERYVAPRLALAGDAAHGVHPIAGQGLNMGLRDVAALAEVLVDAARIGEDIGALNVLERYQAWRRFDATTFALGMDTLNRLFSNDNPAVKLARDVGLAAVNRTGPLRRAFMREAAGTAGEVPRLLRGQTL